jgi:hypothetical protein
MVRYCELHNDRPFLHFSRLFSGAVLQTAPAQSDFQSEFGRLLCNSQQTSFVVRHSMLGKNRRFIKTGSGPAQEKFIFSQKTFSPPPSPAGGAKGPFVDYMDRISALGVDMDDYNTMSTAQVRSSGSS